MSQFKIINAMMMIVSTCIGMGILGLPIVTSHSGFIPTLVSFCVSWVFMTLSAYYILEVKMIVQGSFSLASMIKLTLGKYGHLFSSIIIFLLLYALLSTYLMAGVAWTKILVPSCHDQSNVLISIVFIVFFAFIILCKERFLYNTNNVLGIGVFSAFIAMIVVSLTPSQPEFMNHMSFKETLPSLPLLLTTFGFSIVVPAVVEYLNYDKTSSKWAIVGGSVVSLGAYIIWEWVTLGNIPFQGPGSFQMLKQTGDNGTGVIVALASAIGSHWMILAGKLFAIFIIITSFIGVSLALLHFLADLLRLQPVGKNRSYLTLIMYIPPLLITNFYPNAFVQLLSFAGLFVALLLGLFPAVMVFKMKRMHQHTVSHSMICSHAVLGMTSVFFVLVIVQEIINLIG